MNLSSENETVKKAAAGDGAALARVSVHLQKIVSDYQAHSTRKIAEVHGRIEAKRLSLIALGFYPVQGCEIYCNDDDEPQAEYEV